MKHHQAQSGCRKMNAFLDQPNPLLSARANELIIQQAFFLKSLYIQSKWKFLERHFRGRSTCIT